MHRSESRPGTATLKEFLDEELNEHEDDEKFNYGRWNTTVRHSYIAKLKITSSWYKTKSKAATGIKNTASYIPRLYTT